MQLGDFSEVAESYRRARPSYPGELVSLLIEDAGVQVGDPVADFGAGTGIFTQLLLDHGLRVTAVEPSARMEQMNEARGAVWVRGTFEESRLETASQKWAVAAQAFHWANPITALPEIRRILQPGGVFSILWNNRLKRENEVLNWTEDAIRRHIPEFLESYRDKAWDAILDSTGDFSCFRHWTFRHVVPMTRERYVELWKSHNRLNTLGGPDRVAALLKELDQYLEQHHIEEVEVPYNCEAWSARRR